MNTSTILQVRLPLAVKLAGEKQAIADGFSSFQEAVRLLIKKYVVGAASLKLVLEEEDESYLTSAEYRKIIDESWEDVKKGKIVSREDLIKEFKLHV